MTTAKTILALLALVVCCRAGGDPGHYQAAEELMRLAHGNNLAHFIDSVVAKITQQDSVLAENRDEIHAILRTYLYSAEYRTVRIRAIMRFFKEADIRELIAILKNPSFSNRTGAQVAILKKYDRIFSGLEKEFVEYIYRKLRRRY